MPTLKIALFSAMTAESQGVMPHLSDGSIMRGVRNETLTENSSNLEHFIDQIVDYGFCMLDPFGDIRTWNAGAERLTGYSAQEIIGRHFSIFYTPEDLALNKPQQALDIAIRNGTYQREEVIARKDSTRFWATLTLIALNDKKGVLQGFAEMTHDITEHKTSTAKYRALYENSHDAVLLSRPMDGAILAANPAACHLFGYSEQELLAIPRDNLLDTTDLRFAEAWEERVEVGAVAAELTFIRRGGICFDARVSSKLFTDERGDQVACTNIHDITARKHAEEALRQSEERFRLLSESAPIGIIVTDPEGSVTFGNRKFAKISGYLPEEVVGLTQYVTVLPDDRLLVGEISRKLRSGEIDTYSHERRMLRKDGSTIWVSANATMMPGKQGELREGIILYEDITERKQTDEELRQSEEKFRATFEHAPIGIAECTIEGKIIEVNSKLAEILGYKKDELTHLSFPEITHPTDLEKTLSNLRKLAAGEADSYFLEKRYLRKDRSFVWVNVTTSLTPIHGKPQYMIVTVEDITARKQAEEDLKRAIESSYYQANHDMLTGLANRAAFNDRLREALDYAKRDDHFVAIHLLDLDRFKSINDLQGHYIGDLLLKDVAKRIKTHVRNTDLAARLGGDEFAVIQTHLADPAAAGLLAEKLVEELGRRYVLDNQEVHSGTSIGIAIYPTDAESQDELLKHGDLALYDAKNRGRFNYQFYRKELGIAFHKAQHLGKELVRALRENEFCLRYQPQFDLLSGRMTGIEALLRWRHPVRGELTAAEFILDAEGARLMPMIGEWTLQAACRQYKLWLDDGLAVPLTLNLSSMQLRDPRLLQTLKQAIDEAGFPASMLQLEMRENVLWEPKFPKSLLRQLRDEGFRLALDDVGNEMTALPALDRFPLNSVKPGQDLVRALPAQKREASIMSAIISIAHDLKITVCADGIETADQFTALKEQGCDSAQGYLLSMPLDVDEMTRRINIELVH